jgi:hypothetical protein
LVVYRNGLLALRVRSIADAASLEVNAKGTDFVRRAVRTASPSDFKPQQGSDYRVSANEHTPTHE